MLTAYKILLVGEVACRYQAMYLEQTDYVESMTRSLLILTDRIATPTYSASKQTFLRYRERFIWFLVIKTL